MPKNPDSLPGFTETLVVWFAQHGRCYPWRETQDPWAILVSEVMLQQTTIPTVLGRYNEWMRRFPNPEALAVAGEQEALRSWEGLGYYRRVRALQATARAVTEQYSGIFPRDEAALRALPGVGEYTAAAVLSFAFNEPAVLIDANVARVLARLYNDPTPIDTAAGKKLLRRRAEILLSRSNPRAYNSALMELGQTYCTSHSSLCESCPVRTFCRAKDPASLPVKKQERTVSSLEHWDIWCLSDRGLLLDLQPPTVRHAGMYRLPQRPREEAEALPHLRDQHYSVTRYKVTRHLHRALLPSLPRASEQFIPLARLDSLPLASPDRQLVRTMLSLQESAAIVSDSAPQRRSKTSPRVSQNS